MNRSLLSAAVAGIVGAGGTLAAVPAHADPPEPLTPASLTACPTPLVSDGPGPAPSTTPAMTLPAWGDGTWGSSQNYSTLRTPDLDGDGDTELIGVSPAGLEAWDFDIDTGRWTPLYTGAKLRWTDATGWNQKQYYETLGIADLDGDGTDEVFVRGSGGVESYRFVPGDDTQVPAVQAGWEQAAPVLGQFLDWDSPQFFSTIQAADLDGDGRDEIFGRGSSKVTIAAYDGGWSTGSFAGFTGTAWDTSTTYGTIQAADLDGDGREEIFGRGQDGLEVWDLPSGTATGGTWDRLTSTGPFQDAGGWGNRPYADTVQAADLDGDGAEEVFGRGVDAVQVERLGTDGSFTKMPSLGELTDLQGWDEEYYYATIQAADLDGDGREEILGRGFGGMTVWGYDAAGKKWSPEQRVAGPPFGNAEGWKDVSHYSTIQTADVDGSTPKGSRGSANAARAEILGRGPNGVQTYRWDATSGSWRTMSAGFPVFKGAALAAYQSISLGLTLGEESCDVRSLYASAGASELAGWYEQLSSGNVGLVPALTVSPATYASVKEQIQTELQWASEIASNAARLDELLLAETLYTAMDDTAEHLEYGTKRATKLEGDVLDLLAGIADAVANVAEPGAQVALGVADAAVSFGVAAGGNSSFDGSYKKLAGEKSDRTGSQVADWIATQEAALPAATEATLTDYGLLATIGNQYAQLLWAIPDAGSSDYYELVAANQRGYALWTWQVLTPELPPSPDLATSTTGWRLGNCRSGCLWDLGDQGYAIYTWCDVLLECGDVRNGKVSSTLTDQLFGAPTQTCTNDQWTSGCRLKADKVEVFLGLAGWQIPCKSATHGICAGLEAEAKKYGD
jgi:hypothetical protein